MWIKTIIPKVDNWLCLENQGLINSPLPPLASSFTLLPSPSLDSSCFLTSQRSGGLQRHFSVNYPRQPQAA